MTHSATLLLIDALAVARLTRLIVADTITAPLRERLAGSRPAVTRDLGGDRILVAKRPRLAAFITCPWCVSPHLAIGVTLLQALAPAVCLPFTAVLAFSLVAGLIVERS